MHSGLIVLHQQRPSVNWISPASPWEVWTTCLRHIAIAHSSEVDMDGARLSQLPGEVYRDDEAYQFLLEIVSGLHSPLIGETEVFGQFKDFYDEVIRRREGHWSVRCLMVQLIREVKAIRQEHLVGLGGQSYGSLARKHLAPFSQLALLGSGRLVLDILPWFAKRDLDKEVNVFVRCLTKAQLLSKEFPFSNLVQMESNGPFLSQALVVAAPVQSDWFHKWSASRFPDLRLVLDLRGESDKDPLKGSVPVVGLQEFFVAIEENRRQTEIALAGARNRIQVVLNELRKSVRNRPFGWDDLCA
ncbi:MAG: hypothetical protein IPL83_12005 [Bdellovibrionales bacterium]|nr:hypothetical protein [Bdellovibrionales bacterium]